MTEVVETPVLIVGAGPVGLALALDLGWRGIDCIVVDQNDLDVVLPRASGLTSRTTTAPAPIFAPAPMLTPGMILAPVPKKTSSPTTT